MGPGERNRGGEAGGVSKPIELRKVSRDVWNEYLGECHDVHVDDHEELLEVFMTASDLIRAAIALRDQRRAAERSDAAVVDISR